MAALKNIYTYFRNRVYMAAVSEDGMGVVEVILIIVVRFTVYYEICIGCIT